MKLDIVALRNDIVKCCAIARNNKDTTGFYLAAIKYGIYRANGGTKAIALPPFCDGVVSVVYQLGKIKLNIGKRKRFNYTRAIGELSNIECVRNVVAIESQEIIDVTLEMTEGNVCRFRVSVANPEELWVKAATAIFESYFGLNFNPSIREELNVFNLTWER